MANSTYPVSAHPSLTARGARSLVLLFRAESWLCVVPIAEVAEIHRPLPLEPVAGAPPFVTGVSIVRGAPVPVVRVAALLGGRAEGNVQRIVSLRVGERRVSLEAEEVLGVRKLSGLELTQAPPLLEVAIARYVEQLGTLDGRLLATLACAQIVEDASNATASRVPR